MTNHDELDALLRAGPVRRRDHGHLATTIDRAVRDGKVTAVLPGVYLRTEEVTDPYLLTRAAAQWSPRTVLTGRWAAHHQFWATLDCDTIDLATPTHRATRPDTFRLVRRTIPPQLVGRHQLRRSSHRVLMTRPALTALDLIPELGDEVIHQVLRSRKVTPAQLQTALTLTPQRHHNRERQQHVLDAVTNPWSYAEHRAHDELRAAGLTGWRANPKVLIRGTFYYPDVLFDDERLVIEMDGEHHALDRWVHQSDLWRQNGFTLEGYTTMRYTFDDIERRPDRFIEDVRQMLGLLRRRVR